MTRKDIAIEKLLTEHYVSKSIIKNAFGTTHQLAQEIFDKAKAHELERCAIDPRPNRVQAKSVLDITNTSYSFLKKQYQERVDAQNERN